MDYMNTNTYHRLIFTTLIILFTCFLAFDANAVIIDNLIYRQILKNKPKIDKSYALELSRLILKYSKKYRIPANVFTAILSVESNYILYAINQGSNDFGISQINEYNVKAYKLNKVRLLNDLDYSVWAGAFVFRYFYKRYKRYGINRVIGSYNCGTNPKCVKLLTVKSYIRKVSSRL